MLGRGGSSENKDAGADDTADAEENELPTMQFSAKVTFPITGLAEFIDRLGSENVHNIRAGVTPNRTGGNAYSLSIFFPYRKSFEPEARKTVTTFLPECLMGLIEDVEQNPSSSSPR